MRQAVAEITANVRAKVRRDGIDLAGSGDLAERYVRDAVRSNAECSLGGSLPMLTDERQAERDVLAAVSGYGPLQPYLDDPEIEDLRPQRLGPEVERLSSGPLTVAEAAAALGVDAADVFAMASRLEITLERDEEGRPVVYLPTDAERDEVSERRGEWERLQDGPDDSGRFGRP